MRVMQDAGLFAAGKEAPLSEPGSDARSALLGLLVDELANGALVINENGKILYANLAARREMAHGAMIKDKDGQLHLLSPAAGKAFQGAREQAAIGLRSLLTLSAEDMNATMSVVPLKAPSGGPYEHIALFLSRASVCEPGVLGYFARSYSLTPTEQRVLVFLCHCLSTPEIAIQMKIAVSTVRSHVRSLCIKTSCSGARELIQRVAVLPPLNAAPLVPVH